MSDKGYQTQMEKSHSNRHQSVPRTSDNQSFSDQEYCQYYPVKSSSLSSSSTRQSSPAGSQLTVNSISSTKSQSSKSSRSHVLKRKSPLLVPQRSTTTQHNQGRPEQLLSQCSVCEGPGCGYFVCACRGDHRMKCLDCLEYLIRARDRQAVRKHRKSDSSICPDCHIRYFGIEISRGRFSNGVSKGKVTLLVLSPLMICAVTILLLDHTLDWDWTGISGLFLFVYIIEIVVYLYCAYYGNDRKIRGIRLTDSAIPIRESDKFQSISRELLARLNTFGGQLRQLTDNESDDELA